ncbi:protein phosphatase 2b regulatory subunit, putative [Eimeria brunetti]|uniref:Protein phosphatase 2b regulatory subunit, putative n=2 Tax=Eimeria TaxID=5800 RepID=U6LDA9_9EIME|nr:protein phosphatase 2b regulatory subunit, putative [Eimeria brunetti]
MESILSSIADAPVSAAAKRRAYELVLKILNNIVQAARNHDPNLSKFKWVKSHNGSPLRERVLSVSPLFQELLEALGFRFRVGRPPHVQSGNPQEYMVLEGPVDVEALVSSAQFIEAVICSLPAGEEASPPSAAAEAAEASPASPAASKSGGSSDSAQGSSAPPERPVNSCPRPSSSSSRRADPNAELEAIRREQQERYRQRGVGGSAAARPSSTRGDGDGNRDEDSGGGSWFWQKLGNAQGQLSPQEQKDLVQAANFSERDIKKLYKRFRALDTNHNGELDPHELFDVPEIADNPLVKRVLSIFDTNGDGRVSFIEFLVGLSKLAAGTDEMQKTKFAFDVYDINKDGHISNGELFAVMKMMVGNNLNDQQLQQLVDRTIVQADKDGDGMISFEEFREMVSHIDIADKLRVDV